jgi:hypothetical protein
MGPTVSRRKDTEQCVENLTDQTKWAAQIISGGDPMAVNAPAGMASPDGSVTKLKACSTLFIT